MSRRGVLWLAVLLTVAVFVIDGCTPVSLQISFFYLLPVMMVSWYVDRVAGTAWAFMATALAIAMRIYQTPSGSDEDFMMQMVWEVGTHFILFITVVLILDVVAIKLEHVQRRADRDALTGALNKGAFNQRLHEQLHLARRAEWPLTLAYVDIDHFKKINDTLGHQQGDRALKIVADVMHESVRCTDTVGRMGGDEFALILQNADPQEVQGIIFALRLSLQSQFARWSLPVTCSTGTVTFIDPPLDENVALRAADLLMYKAKQEGRDRNCFQLIHPALHYYRNKAIHAFKRSTTNRRANPVLLSSPLFPETADQRKT